MTDKFIKEIAHLRANELFTDKFFECVNNAWLDLEKENFSQHKVGTIGRNPTQEEIDKYTGYLSEYFDEFYDHAFVKVTMYGGRDNMSSMYVRCSRENYNFLCKLKGEFNQMNGPQIWLNPTFVDMKVNGKVVDLR